MKFALSVLGFLLVLALLVYGLWCAIGYCIEIREKANTTTTRKREKE